MSGSLAGRTTTRRAILIVDVQNDFCEGGSLAVKGGDTVAMRLSDRLMSDAAKNTYDIYVFSRDWHEPDSDNGGHISDNPDFVNSWPAHCIAGTNGAEYHPYLTLPQSIYDRRLEVVKGHGTPAYSAFEGWDMFGTGHTLHQLLEDHKITELDVVGIALDYCVKASAIDAAKAGYRTTVLTYLTASVHPENALQIHKELVETGVTVKVS